jgi:hypothetical protein
MFGLRDGLYKNYTHTFVQFDPNGKLIAHSEQFHFISTGVEFAAGIVEMGDEFVISFGKNDVTSHYARVSQRDVLAMLKPVSL